MKTSPDTSISGLKSSFFDNIEVHPGSYPKNMTRTEFAAGLEEYRISCNLASDTDWNEPANRSVSAIYNAYKKTITL